MILQTLNPQKVAKQTIVRSVRLEYVHADLNGGTSNVSLTMTMKLESTSPMLPAYHAVALQQS